MLAWSEELITDVRKPIIVYDVIAAESYLLITPITSQTVRYYQINRRRTLPASFPLVGCATTKQLGLKDFSRKSGRWHCSRLGAWRFTWLIVVISVRQSTVTAISGLHCRALVMVSSSIRLTAWLQNSKKRAERSERLMYEQSHRDYLHSDLSASSSACHGLLIITVITPLPTKPSATKMPENWSWRTRQLRTDASAWCCLCARCKIRRSWLMLKKLKWCSAWWCCRWSSSVAHQSGLSVSAWSNASAWIMQPPDWRTAERFTLRRLITMQKQLEGTRSILMSSAR